MPPDMLILCCLFSLNGGANLSLNEAAVLVRHNFA
jgi:hypothetical protein